ncbi:MAG: hypothetical protein R2706_00850 [Acidimicrobiales bacterium]
MPTLPFGSWPSPISASLVASGTVGLESVAVRGDELFWSERRPTEDGRVALVRSDADGVQSDVLPPGFSARSRVHEYGGGAWWLGHRASYFVNWDDQRIYRVHPDGADPEPLTPEPPHRHAWRFADGIESADGRWVICVREDHTERPGRETNEPINEIVAVATDGNGEPVVLAGNADFVAAPRLSPDGRWLSWVRWNHPQMPWDGTELCAAPIFDGPRLGNVQVVAGNPNESVIGPGWHSDGRLILAPTQTDSGIFDRGSLAPKSSLT